MSYTTAADIPLTIASPNSTSERRISPSWSIAHLKARLEPITGIPASFQRLHLSHPNSPIEAINEETTHLSQWPLQPYAEIKVHDTRPPGVRENYTDVSAVDHYEMPQDEYESRTDSVLAWKKNQKLGRFAPDAPTVVEQKKANSFREVEERHIKLDVRCRLLPENDYRRGVVRFIGEVEDIPGVGAWVGIELDEPTGKNDGSVKGGKRYFTCAANRGVFVRPERVEVGDFPALDDVLDDEDEEF